MPTVIQDSLQVDGQVYTIDRYPLDPWLASLPDRPPMQTSPFCRNGYVARWAIVDGAMYLVEVSAESIARLLAHHQGPVAALWFSGVIHAWRGDRHHTGYPSRAFFDDEIVFEIVDGIVVREWVLDLRAVPDQTDEEVRLSLPEFLWPARLHRG